MKPLPAMPPSATKVSNSKGDVTAAAASRKQGKRRLVDFEAKMGKFELRGRYADEPSSLKETDSARLSEAKPKKELPVAAPVSEKEQKESSAATESAEKPQDAAEAPEVDQDAEQSAEQVQDAAEGLSGTESSLASQAVKASGRSALSSSAQRDEDKARDERRASLKAGFKKGFGGALKGAGQGAAAGAPGGWVGAGIGAAGGAAAGAFNAVSNQTETQSGLSPKQVAEQQLARRNAAKFGEPTPSFESREAGV